MFANGAGRAAEIVTAYLLDKRKRLLRPLNVVRLLLVLLAVAATFVSSQEAPTPQVQTKTPSTYTFRPETIVSQISEKVSSELDALASNSSLAGFGQYVTAFFLAALMVWTSVKMMASGRGFGELLGEWIPIFISFGVVTLFLDRAAGNLVVSTMDSIGAAIGGANMSTVDSAIRTAAEPIFKAIAAVVDQPRVTAASSGEGIIATMVAGAASMLMSAIAKVITAFILVVAGVLMVATVIMGFISVKLVLLLAPVMVPFLMFKPMSWLFDSWLRFLLGACMLKIVTAFLLKVAAGLLAGMSSLALQHYAEAKGASPWETIFADMVLLGMMLVFALLATLLLLQAPGIATGLLSGSAGSTGFSGIRGLTQGVGGRVGSSGLSAVTTRPTAAVGSEAWQQGKNYFAGKAGARHAAAGSAKDLRYRDPRSKAAYDRAYRDNQRPAPSS